MPESESECYRFLQTLPGVLVSWHRLEDMEVLKVIKNGASPFNYFLLVPELRLSVSVC